MLGATLTAAVVGDLLFGGLQLAGPLIALYTVARRYDRRASLVAAAVAAAALAPSVASRAPDSPLFAIAISVALVATWLIGVSALAARTTLRRDIA